MWYELTLYSLKVGVCLAVFYLFFKLLLSRETFHRFNRIVVLGAILLSFLLPLCVITIRRELPVAPEFFVTDALPAPVAADAPAPFPWRTLVGMLFLTGAVAACLRTLWSLAAVVRMIRRGRRERLDDGSVLVRFPQEITPFSWCRFIVISDADLARNGAAILTHEQAHVRLHHSFDVLVTDLAGCLQWFNPAMWLLRRELRAIHEYEADAAVLASGVDARSYQMLLIRKAVGERWCSVANSFNHSKLKNRITMMLRKKSSRRAEARALLLLPLAGLALGAFAETRYVVPAYKDTQNPVTKHEMRAEIGPDTLVIRGVKGLSDPQQAPLVVIDGAKADAKVLDTLRPERIAAVSVLKDSLARISYGPEARNGVIVVTLKKPGDAAAPSGENGAYGTQVTTSSDGKTMSISISGSPSHASLSTSGLPENPVIVVDGKLFEGELQGLSPERIRSMSVYKGNIPEEYRRYTGSENRGLIVVELKKTGASGLDSDYFRSEEWKRAQMELSEMDSYFKSDEWKEAQKRLSEVSDASDSYFRSEAWKRAQMQLSEMNNYFQSDAWKSAQQKLKDLDDGKFRGSVISMYQTDASETGTSVPCNTVVGGRGGMVVTGPEVMSKSRSDDNGSVTVARGRVTADFSEIDEADYRIEIDGKPATKADLERIEPGKIKRLELVRNDETPGKEGVLRARTRK